MSQTLSFPTKTMDSAFTAQAQLLQGRYLEPHRSSKGKLKGVILQTGDGTYTIKLPKYLRPMLVRELQPAAFIQVWAYPDDEVWRAINVLPMASAETEALLQQWQGSSPEPVKAAGNPTQAPGDTRPPRKKCIQVCRKGKCYKQGSKHIWNALQAEVEANPALQHISIEATGCMKACKKGPNLKVQPKGKMLSGMTPEEAIEVLAKCQ